jgi:hypothetical protein
MEEYETGLDAFKLMDAAEYTIAPMMPFQPMPDRDSIMIGYAGVSLLSSCMPSARRRVRCGCARRIDGAGERRPSRARRTGL